MKIAIDARLYSQSGVGRYLQKLIANLSLIDKKNNYLILLNKEDYYLFNPPGKNFKKELVDISWHSWREQLIFPGILNKLKVDLVHFPYFSMPIFYKGKQVITIHDLIINHFATGRASTKSIFYYKIKRFFYQLILHTSLRKALKVISVSGATKQEIIDHYQLDPRKIEVIYEASDLKPNPSLKNEPIFKFPYLLYIGNAYPHKNLERLINVFDRIGKKFPSLKLVLVGKADYFYRRLSKNIKPSLRDKIIFFSFADDSRLTDLYQKAIAFVFPSLMEGFGLPPLEAMSLGCPVAASKVPSILEICGKAAWYFNPLSSKDMTEKISILLEDRKLRQKLIKAGYNQVKKYSWREMAGKTLKVYESCHSL